MKRDTTWLWITFVLVLAAGSAEPEIPILNAEERLEIHSILAAYTINGARVMSQQDSLGSIEVGKLADLIIIDQDVVALAENDRAHDISDTQVLLTLFDGRIVFEQESTTAGSL